jgi:Cu2+-exporting ATPase
MVTRGYTLETLARATHIIFDKTRTLTAGRIRLLKIHSFSTLDRDRVLQLSASLEKHSEHPIAKALVRAFQGSSLSAVDVKNTPGGGILGNIEGKTFGLGTAQFVRQHCAGAVTEELSKQQMNTSNTLVFLAESDVLHAALELGDEVRPDAFQLIQKLRNDGLQIFLLSGDNPNATRQVARLAAIEDNNAVGGLTPAAKLGYVQDLQAKGAVVAMVGDGVNDAPVLARAQVSIAMGSGAQVALANADMITLSPHLLSLASAFQFARKTQHVIYQNISWAIFYNLLALPAAALGWIAPWMAALGMSLSSLLVVANALRLTLKKEGQAG